MLYIYISYIIYNRMALYCLRKKKGGGGGSIHEYILHISYILYHRLFVHCLKNVYMNIYFIYHNSMIHHRLSVYCLKGKKRGVYMSISFISRISFIIVCCFKKEYIHQYPGQSAKSAGGRLQLNTHTPYLCGFA